MKKTLYSDVLDTTFLKPIDDLQNFENKVILAKDYFYIKNFKNAKRYFLYFFELYENIILVRKSEEEKPLAYMEVENCFMRVTVSPWKNNDNILGIKFFKKKVYEEIFHENKSIIKKWFKILKRTCILIKFRNYFEDIKVIGNGNFAKVFLVQKKTTKEKFAVKVFDKNLFIHNDPNETKCITNEINILKSVDHPNLLKLHEIYEGENHVYCLCQYYKGYNLLESLIENGMPNLNESIFIIEQILKGVTYLAEKNIIHRDIKPENIIVYYKDIFQSKVQIGEETYFDPKEDQEDNVKEIEKNNLFKKYSDSKNDLNYQNSFDRMNENQNFNNEMSQKNIVLVDFGFATYQKDYKNLFVRCGTPGFVAPEILEDLPYNTKVDIYSIGIIFFLLLSGDIPFDSDSYRDMVYLNSEGNINFEILMKMGVPDKIIFIVKKMLEKNPDARFSGEECLDLIEKYKEMNEIKHFQFYEQKSEKLLHFENIEKKQYKQKMPDKTRDLSPNGRSVDENVYEKNNYNF